MEEQRTWKSGAGGRAAQVEEQRTGKSGAGGRAAQVEERRFSAASSHQKSNRASAPLQIV
ncbi:MAG TPA: hypothetical protein VGM18_02780 [Candidatus Sulfotelmatobacter sp.]